MHGRRVGNTERMRVEEEHMNTFLRIILAATAFLMAVIGFAHAQNSPVYVVTYVDVMPNITNSGAALLQHYRDESRKEDSNLRTIVLQAQSLSASPSATSYPTT
jgi:hypothetical protein